jgi:DNA polymerase IV
MTVKRHIMHIDLDSFFVSVERKLNPRLAGIPVLVGGSSDRGVVASCSYEARAFGIHSAMPMRRARQLCPQAVVVKGSHGEYSKYSEMVTEIISNNVPVFEKSSIDEFYIDMTGMDKFFGCYNLATELRQKIIHETGLPISFALSTSKTVAKIGTGTAKPNGQRQIPEGEEKTFLAPLSVRKIPGVGAKTFEILSRFGIGTIGSLQEFPVKRLQYELGESGVSLWERANGIDDTPVEPYSERKSISTECTFEEDTFDHDHLKRVLLSMTEKLCFQLRNEELLTACAAIKIRYSDFNTVSMQAKIPYTALDGTLISKVKELFDKLIQKNLPVRLIGVRFSHLVHGTYQFDLFNDTAEQLQLYSAMDKLRLKFGDDAVIRAAGLNLNKRDPYIFKGGRD